MPWCKFFIPKIASSDVSASDPRLNEHIMYAKCIKGHVIRSANDWILCENLPEADAKCWQEGGDTIFSLRARKRAESQSTLPEKGNATAEAVAEKTATRTSKS